MKNYLHGLILSIVRLYCDQLEGTLPIGSPTILEMEVRAMSQTTQRRPDTPLAILVREAMPEQGLTRGAMAAGLGYRNVNRGLRRLDHWQATGEMDDTARKRLSGVLGRSLEVIADAAQATRTQLA